MKGHFLLVPVLLLFAPALQAQEETPPVPSAPVAPVAPVAPPASDELARLRETVDAQQRALAELDTRVSKTEALAISGYLHLDWNAFRQS